MAHTQKEIEDMQSMRDAKITTQTEYYVSDGVELAIDIYRPNPQKYPGVRPGILFFFGGGFQVGTRWAFREHGEACAKQGYVALSADYRIKCNHGTTPRESMMDGAQAWQFVKKHASRWMMDSDRIVLSGGSAGGLISTMCEQLTGIKPFGLALFNPGILDEKMGPENLTRALGTEVNGIPVTNTNSVRKDSCPILIMHGEEDLTVPVSTIRKYAEYAKEQGVDTKLVVYPGMGHGFMNYNKNRAHYYLTMGELLIFLEKLNKVAQD